MPGSIAAHSTQNSYCLRWWGSTCSWSQAAPQASALGDQLNTTLLLERKVELAGGIRADSKAHSSLQQP